MCTAVGLEVGRLRRIAIGGVKLGMLKPGAYRDLTKDERVLCVLLSEKVRTGEANDFCIQAMI